MWAASHETQRGKRVLQTNKTASKGSEKGSGSRHQNGSASEEQGQGEAQEQAEDVMTVMLSWKECKDKQMTAFQCGIAVGFLGFAILFVIYKLMGGN